MDQVSRIKELVKISLDTSFGGGLTIEDLVVLPTHKFDDEKNEWVLDSHTIFLSVKKTYDLELKDQTVSADGHFHTTSSNKITNLLEGLLGFEVCVDVL